MKTLKLMMAVIACVLITNFVMAEKPTDNEKKVNLADLIIDKLDKDVQLTDEQKVALKKYTIVFIDKNDNAQKISKEKEKQDAKKLAYKEFEYTLDSLLTDNQRILRKIKIQEREHLSISKK